MVHYHIFHETILVKIHLLIHRIIMLMIIFHSRFWCPLGLIKYLLTKMRYTLFFYHQLKCIFSKINKYGHKICKISNRVLKNILILSHSIFSRGKYPYGDYQEKRIDLVTVLFIKLGKPAEIPSDIPNI